MINEQSRVSINKPEVAASITKSLCGQCLPIIREILPASRTIKDDLLFSKRLNDRIWA